MRERMASAPGNFPAKILCGLLLLATLILLSVSENKSLKGEHLNLLGLSNKYALLVSRDVPELCQFTVCIDLSRDWDSGVSWTAFSYDTSSSSTIELALLGTPKNLIINLSGISLEFENGLSSNKLIRLCCVWDSYKGLLELFHNGEWMKNVTLSTRKCLKPNGTLIMGQLHKNKNGAIEIVSGWSFVGILHYFQMWDYVREQQEMMACLPGNVVSWQSNSWSVDDGITASALHLPCGDLEVTSVIPPTQTTAPDRTVSDPTIKVTSEDTDVATKDPTKGATVFTPGLPGMTTSTELPSTVYSDVDTVTPLSSFPDGDTTNPMRTVPISQTTSEHSQTMPMSSPSYVITPSKHDVSTPQSDVPLSTSHFTTTEPLAGSSKVTATTSTDTKTTLRPLETPPSLVVPVSVTFYNIQMNFSVSYKPPKTFDYYDVKKLSTNWFQKMFFNSEFEVINHNIKSNMQLNIPQGTILTRTRKLDEKQELQSYSSKSVIKATSNQTAEEEEKKLYHLLGMPYTEEEQSLKADSVTVAAFAPGTCAETVFHSKNKGSFKWLEQIPVGMAYANCERNREQSASRACAINIEMGTAYWRRPNLTECHLLYGLPENIMALENVTISEENAEDVADHILNLLNSSKPNEEETEVIVNKLTDIANCEEISATLAAKVLKIISSLMAKVVTVKDLPTMTSSILRIMEKIGFKMDFSGRNVSVILPRLALALMRPDPISFEGVAFGVTSYKSHMDPEIKICETPFQRALAAVFLPALLKNYLGVQSFDPKDHTEIQFNFFGNSSLFKESSPGNKVLNTYIVGASIRNVSVQNLKEPVNIILQHIRENTDKAPVQCVFWDFLKNNGHGGWNASGCEEKYTDTNYTICNCNHLTHFGVLLDLSQSPISAADNWILTLVSYVGCGISSIFLGLAVVVYLSIDKLSGDYPSKILINLCLALLMLNLVFLVNSWLASFQNHSLCIAAGVFLHYFLLAAFTWMGLEAVHMYYALIKVFNTYIPNYILKFSIAGWGIPAVIVAIVLIIRVDFYGTKNDSPLTFFCWIQNSTVFYISVVAYFCLMFLMNLAMFILVLLQIHAMKSQGQVAGWSQGFLHDVKRVASLTFLLGLTWGFAFFAWGPVKIFFFYLFAICNTLQGFFLFLFYCLLKENVRKQCQVYFCCGRFSLRYSDWRGSGTMPGYQRPQNTSRRLSSHSSQSDGTNSTSNGSGSLARASPDMHVETDQIHGSTETVSSTCQPFRLPRARIVSPVDAGLHGFQKTKLWP